MRKLAVKSPGEMPMSLETQDYPGMKQKIQSRHFFRIGLIVLALLTLFLTGKIVRQPFVSQINGVDGEDEVAFDSEFASFLKENGYGAGDLSKTLFMDSILSIVQNYYVEPSRASNQDLIHGVAAVLADEIPDFHLVKQNGQKVLEISGEPPISIPEKAGYLDLLKFVFLVSKNLESYQKKHPSDFNRSEEPENMVLNALLKGLDAHSSILNREAYRDLRQGTEGSFGGLGVLVGMRSNILTVVKPIRNSPAERAGIKKSDKIIAINSSRTFGQSLDELVGYMRGDPGTVVKMTVLRENQAAPINYELKREVIQVESVQSEFFSKNGANIAFIAIETFSNRTAEEVHQALKAAREKFGGKLSGLVLDLRSNPGGLLDQAVQVADLFLKDGIIVSTEGRRNEVERAGQGYHEEDYPITLLIDGDTASASEIVAGALQDHDRAVVIGQKSFGKGSVQTIFELPGERALKLTVARYYTPLHRSIQGSGIVPDFLLSPVYSKEKNINLLGAGKYRTEGMLRNSLSRELETVQPAHSMPTLESVYLNDSVEEQDPQAGELENDYLRSIAENLITEVSKTYPAGIPAGARRADHWIALALPSIRQKIAKEADRAAGFLRKKFDVDWTEESKSTPSANVKVSLKQRRIEVLSTPAIVKIPVTMTGVGVKDSAATRVSLLFKPRTDPLLESEVLVGKITAGESRIVQMPLSIPTVQNNARVSGSLYPVLNGQIQFDAGVKVVLEIRPEQQLGILPEVAFEDGENSIIKDAIDPGERGFVRVRLRNETNVSLKDLVVEISNLSGSQVILSKPKFELNSLSNGEMQELRFPIIASNSLVSKEIEVGITIGTKENGNLYRKSFVYRASPESGNGVKSGSQVH